MQAYLLTLSPETAFGTPLVGDTLFGQICWGIAEQYGETLLEACLQDYTADRPFLVVSDAFPQNHLPLPTLPSAYWQQGEETDRKKLKKRQWLPETALTENSRRWQEKAKSSSEIALEFMQSNHKAKSGRDIAPPLICRHSQPHNSLNRQTHTTGAGGQFAPHESEQIWYAAGHSWQIYLLLDEGRLKKDELQQVLANIGLSGYGRDASAGLGKYRIISLHPCQQLPARFGLRCRAQLLPYPNPLRPPRQRAGHRRAAVQTACIDGANRCRVQRRGFRQALCRTGHYKPLQKPAASRTPGIRPRPGFYSRLNLNQNKAASRRQYS